MSRKGKNNGETRVVTTLEFTIVMVVLLVLLLLSILTSITFGNADISVKEVYSVLANEILHLKGFENYSQGSIHDVVWIIRFPRVILAIAIGIGLSVCGVVMQAVVKNPLADPYVLGISSGASMGATLAILFGVGSGIFGGIFGSSFVGVMAFIGAMVTSFGVLFISNIGGTSNAGKLILSGMAVSAVCSAFTNFATYIAHNQNATLSITFWTMGSLASADWDDVLIILALMIAGTFVFWSQYRNLNLMLLGDETAVVLGTDLSKLRNKYLILSSLLIAVAVYSAGTIGFVGLVIPHAVRMFYGTDHKRLIPLCALVGAIFLIWADVACRIILQNAELPIGILISMIGAPCFIYLMASRSYGFGGER
ncbi:iron complex transport system permease protein [Acetitomaculum ruminis DSM 5522]|uniref:Iron complex transport system permease protein n=1 Tax=Acetitomaculum ruminis DSM 5522 TaxID=1120918 RepID=A0A1I0WNM2_9FIRM|nr:iron ABC transporter permease [Acetitomaculum ruminis]SFA90144.1 iron complex transport system permease protein [Acetitomaculum ruminis DSM 5522]